MPPSELDIELRRRLREAGLSQLELSRIMGMSRSWVAQELLGKPEQTIKRLFINEPAQLAELAQRLGWQSGHDMMASLGLLEHAEAPTLPRHANLTELPSSGLVPVYAIADAHRPLTHKTRPLDLEIYVAPEHRRPGMRLFGVDGESMNNGTADTIRHGDVVFVDTHDLEPRDGAIYVIHIHGDGNTVKRARVLGGQYWLFSDNPNQGEYPPFQPSEADIIGCVYLYQPPPRKPK